MRIMKKLISILLAVMWLTGSGLFAQATEFTYQGKLLDSSSAATGNYDFQFTLWDAPADGIQIGTVQSINGVAVANGLFTVRLDFGSAAFSDGSPRFLQIAVKPASGVTFTTLAPRQTLTSAPYSVRAQSAGQSDTALDSQKLGGIDASEYVTTSTVGNSFIRNNTALQTGNFNISGNGVVGGNLGIGTSTPQSRLSISGNGYGFTQTNGTVTVGSFLSAGSGWLGTRSNHPLNFFTNDGGAQMQLVQTGEVGVGVIPQSGWRLDVGGIGRFQTANGNINLGTPNTETGMTILPLSGNRADLRFNGTILTIAAGAGTGVPANTGITVNTAGNVGIGTTTPGAKLHVETPGGIGGIPLRVVSQGLGGSAIVAVGGPFGGNAFNGTGNIVTTGNIKQDLNSNGVVKAMVYVEYAGSQIPTIIRCYDGINGSTASDCGIIYGPISLGLSGTVTRMTFTHVVNNRYISVTAFGGGQASVFQFPNAQTVDILNNYANFYIFIY